jgi:hypothetical protein
MRVSAEEEAERHYGKIIVFLSEAKKNEMEFALLAKMLYINPAKLRYWLIKRKFWNDHIAVEKRGRRLFVRLYGPEKCWLAAVYNITKYPPESGNEIFKRMISVRGENKRAIFAHKLEDESILLCFYEGWNNQLLVFVPLKPDEFITNGEIAYKVDNPRVRGIVRFALEQLGITPLTTIEDLKRGEPHFVGWLFETIGTVKINEETLERALREKVVFIGEERKNEFESS